jgi:hypothetical protein
MNPIITKQLIDVRYVLGGHETAKSRYNQIKGTFPDGNEYRIFAEPIIHSEGNKITWSTEYQGTIINFNHLTMEEQSRAKDLFSVQMKKLFDASKSYQDSSLTEFLYKCIEIPSMQSIFIIRHNNEDKVVLTEWAFVSDTPGAEKGLLEKIINAKRVPMMFDVIYQDETAAPDEEIYFEYEGKKTIMKSDVNGRIVLDSVKVESYVKAYQSEKNTPYNHHSFTCYEFGNYKIKVAQKIDMKFVVMNSNNKIMPNMTFNFSFKDEMQALTSDPNGVMMLTKIKVETEVKAFQIIEGKEENVNRFICEQKRGEYLIIIPVPAEPVSTEPEKKDYRMKFKVVDDNNEIVPNAEITVKYEGKTAKVFTDEFGFAILEGVEPGTQVKVVAKGEKKKK